MTCPYQIVAFDVDTSSLNALRKALPGWQVRSIDGATVNSLPRDWTPGETNLFVMGVREHATETLGLCRFLAFFASCRQKSAQDDNFVMAGSLRDHSPACDAPILVLVSAGQEKLIEALLRSGAHSCLMLPIHAQDVAAMLRHARAGNQPGRHTLNLESAQVEDRWRDDGGQG